MRFVRVTLATTIFVFLSCVSCLNADSPKLTPQTLKAARRAAAWQPRQLIYNNDGNDSRSAKEKTREAFLRSRTTPLADTNVDAIFYCDGIWGTFTHRSPTADLRAGSDKAYKEWAVELINDGGPDPLGSVIDFGHKNNIEVFWSLRMNDTHDSKDPTMLSPWKKAHPECLLGKFAKQRSYKGGGRRWSAVDYSQKAVRDRTVGWFDEVAASYDVDGFELDFFRHLIFFKNPLLGKPATQENLDQMTEVVRRIREIADRHALRRGRPILITIRVPDSVGYCREVGLDIERWLKEGLIDMMTVSGYFRLNPWKTSVELGHRYDVPVYAGLSESRLKPNQRKPVNTVEEYRGRALSAWREGVDGIYLFNMFDVAGRKSPMLRELGDPALLEKLPKIYTTGSRSPAAAKGWLATGRKYINRPAPLPTSSRKLSSRKPVVVDLDVWDELGTGSTKKATLRLSVKGSTNASALKATINGQVIKLDRFNQKGISTTPLPGNLLKRGTNRFTFQLNKAQKKPTALRDLIIAVE